MVKRPRRWPQRYEATVSSDSDYSEPLTLGPGAHVPHLAEIKYYMRFFAKLSKGRLAKDHKFTAD